MKLKVKFYLCGATFILIYIIVRVWNPDVSPPNKVGAKTKIINKIENNNSNKPVRLEKEVTVLLRYSHDTSKHLASTVNSFLSVLPALPIIIVSDMIIPREIMYNFSNTSGIINIPLKLDLMNLVVDRNVGNYIKTKYLFIVPVGVILHSSAEISYLIKALNQSTRSFVAVPVEKAKFKCLRLELNLIQWSIQYKTNFNGSDCDTIQGDHGIFMHSKTLRKIGEPFLQPFPEAFYIQTASLRMKIKLLLMTRLKTKFVRKTHVTLKSQFHRQLMNKQFKIKKVIRENGIVEWYGCTRNTQRCFPNVINSVPEYINQGRWTPPCCLKVLRETVHHVFKVLKEYNVTFWLEGGSLLGAMRTKDIIPWDYDVDIGVYLDDISKCPWLNKIQLGKSEKNHLPSIVDNKGFVWEKASVEEGDFYRVQASVHNRLHVDIFPFFVKNGIMTKKTWFPNHPQDTEFPEHYLKPLTTIEFTGIEAPAPNNVKEFLELKFGEGCVENPQYPNPKLYPFPSHAKLLMMNDTYNYDFINNPP